MTARTHCEHPEACQAKRPGRHCRRCNMRRLHQDPAFKAANAERAAKHMRRLNQDPEFKAANAERAAKHMRRLNQDPEFKASNAERMRHLHQDPAFKAAHAKRSAERMRRLNQDPEFKAKRHPHLAVMTADQRADYDTLRRDGYSMRAALAHLGLLAAAE